MARNRLTTELHVIHCSATPARMDIGLEEIHRWHVQKGIFSERGRTGYHFVIRRDGSVEIGRDLREQGAHALGFNDESLGTCMVGGLDRKGHPENNFTPEQWHSLEIHVDWVRTLWPTILTAGHREFSNRACPCFDVYEWMRNIFGVDDREMVERYKQEHRDRW